MKIKRTLWDIFLWMIGSAVFSVSVNMFSAPNNIVQGGLTGIATVINYLVPSLPIGTAIFIMNIPLFLLAWKYLKGGFLVRTVCATAVFTAFIDLGSFVIMPYKGDTLLGCIFCGVLSGIGLALVFMTGATTGGTDIIAMLLRKKNPRFSMGRVILFIDFAIVLLSFAVYGEIESIMYAIIVIFLSSKVIDTVLYGSDHSKIVFIITEQGEDIISAIFREIGRGATVLPVKGGYTQKEKELILCAAKKMQIRNILRLISQKDPKAFTVVCDAGEVLGEGFR
ncbi:MAG: YitT family protein [Clostridia bacterium]|nr:YitT family protein [Clostridia bacterium]